MREESCSYCEDDRHRAGRLEPTEDPLGPPGEQLSVRDVEPLLAAVAKLHDLT